MCALFANEKQQHIGDAQNRVEKHRTNDRSLLRDVLFKIYLSFFTHQKARTIRQNCIIIRTCNLIKRKSQ